MEQTPPLPQGQLPKTGFVRTAVCCGPGAVALFTFPQAVLPAEVVLGRAYPQSLHYRLEELPPSRLLMCLSSIISARP